MALFPPYSIRFLLGTVVTPATTRTYTVPAGQTAIISDLTAVSSNAAAASGAGFYVTATGLPASYIWTANLPIVAGAPAALNWHGHIVLNAGDVLTATFIGLGAQVFVTASGYLLTG